MARCMARMLAFRILTLSISPGDATPTAQASATLLNVLFYLSSFRLFLLSCLSLNWCISYLSLNLLEVLLILL